MKYKEMTTPQLINEIARVKELLVLNKKPHTFHQNRKYLSYGGIFNETSYHGRKQRSKLRILRLFRSCRYGQRVFGIVAQISGRKLSFPDPKGVIL